MKKIDAIFILCSVLVIAPFFISTTVYDWFLMATKTHPYLMSFVKFAVLSTAGECIGLRIKTGHYSTKGFGVIPRGITWGFLGVLISSAMTVFSNGVPAFLVTLGISPADTTYTDLIKTSILESKSLYHFLAAFSISVFMNCIFAPIFMVIHKVSDTHILNNNGTLTGYFSKIHFGEIFTNLDWYTIWNFLFKKTIPLFWIPAHTITFMLAPEYRVLFAALLGVFLGLLMSFATKKK